MLYTFLKHLKEALGYVGQVSEQIEKDKKYSTQISLEELDVTNYDQAIHHLHLAMEFLNKQKEVTATYQRDEEEKESKKSPFVVSEKIN